MNRPELLSALKRASVAAIDQRNEFWILAGLSDSSYEEGVRNAHFARVVRAYAEAGVPDVWLEQLRLGINGNLCAIIQDQLPSGYSVRRNQGRGQDVLITDEAVTDFGRIE
jgi:hypothetical protein